MDEAARPDQPHRTTQRARERGGLELETTQGSLETGGPRPQTNGRQHQTTARLREKKGQRHQTTARRPEQLPAITISERDIPGYERSITYRVSSQIARLPGVDAVAAFAADGARDRAPADLAASETARAPHEKDCRGWMQSRHHVTGVTASPRVALDCRERGQPRRHLLRESRRTRARARRGRRTRGRARRSRRARRGGRASRDRGPRGTTRGRQGRRRRTKGRTSRGRVAWGPADRRRDNTRVSPIRRDPSARGPNGL